MEDASYTETSSTISGSTHTIPQQQPENTEIFLSSRSSAPSSPSSLNPTGTLSRFSLKSPTSPTAAGASSPGQVSAITVVALLDKLVNMLETVQDNQRRMEVRQVDLEGAVQTLQGDVNRLSKTHLNTSTCVTKLLERSRKVNVNVKEVKERLDRQAVQVKKLESNHNHLLKRNNFKVLIFQEDNEIPANVVVKDSFKTPQPSQYDAESTHPTPSITGSVEAIRTQDEALQTISLSSDDDADLVAAHLEADEMLHYEAAGGGPVKFERRADQFKRNSLKKVDSLKRAFTRENIEKKMNKISSRVMPVEKREKLRKSFIPNHPKSPSTKNSSFKVSNMTFNVKKVRDGEVPSQLEASPVGEAHVEIPTLEGLDGKSPLAEVHAHESVVEQIQEVEEEIQETLHSPTPESLKVEVSLNGETPSVDCEVNGDGVAGLAVPEHVEDVGEEEEEEEEGEEKHKSPVETTADVKIVTEAVITEQVS